MLELKKIYEVFDSEIVVNRAVEYYDGEPRTYDGFDNKKEN